MFLLRWVVTAVAVWIAVELVPGLGYDRWQTLAVAALVLGVLNTFVKPILEFFTFPLIALSFGLFLIVINALMLKMTASMVTGFTVETWGAAIVASVIISVVSLVLGGFGVRRMYRW